MKGKPIDPLGMGSLQFLSRVAVHRSCHSCWETARSRAMDTRQAARVARAETRSKLSNNMMMDSTAVSLKYRQVWKVPGKSPWMNKKFGFFCVKAQSLLGVKTE